MITLVAALLCLGLCVVLAGLFLPWDIATRIGVGTAAGGVAAAVITAWGSAVPPGDKAPQPSPGAGLTAMLSAYDAGRGAAELRYEGRTVDGSLWVGPRDPYLDLVRAGGELVPQRYWISKWADDFVWPQLDVKVVNNTAETVFFHEALFHAERSRTDPRPLPIIDGIAYGPYLTLTNLGWGPMEECVLRFQLERHGDPEPLTAERSWPLGPNGAAEDKAPLLAALAEAGVDVPALEAVRWVPERTPEGMTALGPFERGPAMVAGVLEFTQADSEGRRARRSHEFRSVISFTAAPAGVPRPPTCDYEVRLRADGDDYLTSVQISHSLAAGESDRFLFTVAAERSSLHDLTISLLYNGGERLDCGRAGIELFLSTTDARIQLDGDAR